MKLDMIHHIAIIGRDRDAMLHFYVDQLGFAIVSEYDRPERGDILINLRQGQLTLELFIKPTAPERPKIPLPEHAGLRHLAFKVEDVEAYLARLDQVLQTQAFATMTLMARKWHFSSIQKDCPWKYMSEESNG